MNKKVITILSLSLILVVALPFTLGSSNIDMQGYLNAYGDYTAPYNRIIRPNDNYVYDDQDTSDWFSRTTTWADTDIPMVEDLDVVGGWQPNIPSTIRPGWYHLTFYERVGATAAKTDTYLYGYIIHISGYGKIDKVSQP